MADKRITAVDEMTNPDEGADFVLVVRGTQRDLRRLRMNLLPKGFDLHDDVETELTSLHDADRILISDEGSPGAPQRFTTLRRLQSFFTNAFDLHDDVAAELTAAADEDRMLISDEGASGDPQKWISIGNLKKSLGFLAYELLPAEYAINERFIGTVSHNLGRPPVLVFPVLVCKVANNGYSVGDLVYVSNYFAVGSNGGNHAFAITASSANNVTFVSTGSMIGVYLAPNKANASDPRGVSATNWRVKAMIVG